MLALSMCSMKAGDNSLMQVERENNCCWTGVLGFLQGWTDLCEMGKALGGDLKGLAVVDKGS